MTSKLRWSETVQPEVLRNAILADLRSAITSLSDDERAEVLGLDDEDTEWRSLFVTLSDALGGGYCNRAGVWNRVDAVDAVKREHALRVAAEQKLANCDEHWVQRASYDAAVTRADASESTLREWRPVMQTAEAIAIDAIPTRAARTQLLGVMGNLTPSARSAIDAAPEPMTPESVAADVRAIDATLADVRNIAPMTPEKERAMIDDMDREPAWVAVPAASTPLSPAWVAVPAASTPLSTEWYCNDCKRPVLLFEGLCAACGSSRTFRIVACNQEPSSPAPTACVVCGGLGEIRAPSINGSAVSETCPVCSAGEKPVALVAVAWTQLIPGSAVRHTVWDTQCPVGSWQPLYSAATVRELQAEIERLTSENARLLGALDVAIGYTQQRDELTAEVARLTAENKDRCAAIADWARATGRSTPDDARIRIESLLGANARADAYGRSLADRTAELGAVRRERDASLDARGVERDSARAEVARLTAEVRAYERTITSNAGAFLTRIDKLTASLASVTAERDEARADIERYNVARQCCVCGGSICPPMTCSGCRVRGGGTESTTENALRVRCDALIVERDEARAREDDASNRAQRFKDARDDARAQLAAQQSPPPAPTKGE